MNIFFRGTKTAIRISNFLQQTANATLKTLVEIFTKTRKITKKEIELLRKITTTETINTLKPLLGDRDSDVRRAAATAIGEVFRGTGSMEALRQLKPLLRDSSEYVRRAAVWAIGEIFRGMGSLEALQLLEPLLGDSYSWVREAAKKAIEMIKSG